jgi:predicted trehalose synthase
MRWTAVLVGAALAGCAAHLDMPADDLAFGQEARSVCVDYVDALNDRIAQCENKLHFDGFDCGSVLYASKSRAEDCTHALPKVACGDLRSCNSAFVFE